MFKLTRPCDNCPFRKVGGIRLHPERAIEIANNAIRAQGATFMCHKTVTHDDDGEHAPTDTEQYCAGALAFALNVGSLNQFMRIAMRIRNWNPKAINRKSQGRVSIAS